MPVPGNDVFMNRKRWSGVDVKKAEVALAKFDPAKMSIDQYVDRIKDDFPTRSNAAIKEKLNSLAAELGIDMAAPGARASVARNLDNRWTKEELELLDDLLKEFDPTKKSAREFGREIADFFKERHSELAVQQRVSTLTRDIRERAVSDGHVVPGASHMRRVGDDEPGFAETLQAVAERASARKEVAVAERAGLRSERSAADFIAHKEQRQQAHAAAAAAAMPPTPAPLALAAPREAEQLKFRDLPDLRRSEIYDAIVTGTADYGVFIRVEVHGDVVEGLVHFLEIADGTAYFNPREEFHIGEQLEVVWLERTAKGHAFSLKRAGYVLKTERKRSTGAAAALPALPAPGTVSPYPAFANANIPLPALPAPAAPRSLVGSPSGSPVVVTTPARPITPAPPTKPVVSPTVVNMSAAMKPATPPPSGSLIDQLTEHLIQATSLTQQLINNQKQPEGLQLAWDAINEALAALNAMELKKGITILETFKAHHMKQKER